MTWHAKYSVGGLVGLLLIVPLVVLDGWLLHLLIVHSVRAQQINFGTFLIGLVVLLSVPVLLVLAYQTLSCLTLRYHLDRNRVAIRWFGCEQILPVRDIEQIVPGRELGNPLVRRHGFRWAGHERGEGWVSAPDGAQGPGLGRTRFLATRPVAEQLFLVTPGRVFAISPRDPEGFLSAFEARRELGPNRLVERELRRAGWFTWPFWTDRTAWALLGAALVVNLGLFAILCARFPGLDFELPLHFTSLGQVDRIGTKMELFALPIIGLLILATNLGLGLPLYRQERAGSYLLWGAAAVVQALFWLAAMSIVP